MSAGTVSLNVTIPHSHPAFERVATNLMNAGVRPGVHYPVESLTDAQVAIFFPDDGSEYYPALRCARA
jgi:hypothetical protein